MYLNKKKFLMGMLVNGGLTLLFGQQALLFAFYLLLTGTDQIEARSDITGESTAILTVFLILFILFLKRVNILLMAMKMSRLFENDKDGLLSMEVIAKRMKKSQEKVVSAFIKCVGKGLLVDCGIYAVDPAYVILGNGAGTIRERYRVMRCASCGATNVNRIGFENKCKYCGAVTED